MADEANAYSEPPLVVRVDEVYPESDLPLEKPVKARPRPGVIEAIAWCLIFLFMQLFISALVIVFVLFAFAVQQPDPKQFLNDQAKVFAEANSPDIPAGETRPAVPREIGQALAYGMLGAQFASLGLILIVLPWRIGKGWRKQINLKRPAIIHVLLILLLAPGFMLLSGGIQELLQVVFGIEPPTTNKLLGDMFRSFPWYLTFLAIGLGPGVVEEIFCRGFLGRGLTARYGLLVGVTLTSLMFGLMHCSVSYAIPTAIMGVYLHFVYLTSRSLWISILLHTLNNSVAVLATLSGGMAQLEADPQGIGPAIYLLSFSLILFASIALFTSRPRPVVLSESSEEQLKSTDGNLDHPGPSALPHDSGESLKCGKPSPIALVLTFISFASLMYLLFQ
jgi:membrane protease YdiL (CAAX protease family)